ncbi:Gmad2 immunoglobulin-like domain-containing protein [Micromonospora sp. WMMD710]|uniref:Gmad2 immunoglobulin-like domain-containing protein n=1 Tax=Micromonospora sp. WMMD710 TaxID=3016085 RepID=UPI002416828F|nr:Gmad2 immunoglobulin-like domain-containing protein [Micromonospora sp. WMMD710]MDG4758373.1 Gmad2 immunoglobulin-like domain-containing protein [Micromonospora sp. WMMD710]
MSRRDAARLTASLLVAAVVVAACGTPRSGDLGPAPTAVPSTAVAATGPPDPVPASPAAPRPAPSGTDATVRSPARSTDASRPATVTIELWYVRAGLLAPTRRARPATVATSRLALTELAAGPTPTEAATGMTTLLPAGVEVTRIADGVATLGPVPAGDDPPPERRLREAQVVWTLTQFPTVRQVRFDGGAPLGRASYTDLLPPIVVTGPVPGDRVSAPLTVTGTADVFEATVSVRVLDAAGREVASGFGTAGCGSGCRGGYRVVVGWRTTREQRGTVEVYEVSARDGSRINTVAVPVVLAPGP